MKIIPLSKKSMEPVTVTLIIIGIIFGLFVADKVGLFSTYPPETPQTNLAPYANPFYFDTAVQQGTTWECSINNSVNFRTSSLTYDNSEAIAYTSNCGATLTAYGYFSGSGSLLGTCTQKMPTYISQSWTLLLSNLPGGWLAGSENPSLWQNTAGDLIVCDSDTMNYNVRTYKTSDPDASKVTTGHLPSTPTMENICGNVPIQDSGKYTCENNNVVTKFCVYNSAVVFPSDVIQACDLGCSYMENYQLSGIGIKNIVKCNGNYRPNIKVCSDNSQSLYTTTPSGDLNNPTLCGVNQFNMCVGTNPNSVCLNCKEGTSWCNGNITTSCINGNVVPGIDCSGDVKYCHITGIAPTFSAPDTIASCTQTLPDGSKQCSGSQPQILVGGNWQNNGPSCRTNCSSGECEDICQSGEMNCESQFALLQKCDLSDSGNMWINYVETNSNCLSGSCLDSSHCTSLYNINNEYCLGKQRQGVVPDAGNLLAGEVKKQNLSVAECHTECLGSNTPTTYCQILPQCVGKLGLDVCENTVTVSTCNIIGDLLTFKEDCSLSPRGFCDASLTPVDCNIPDYECYGRSQCRSEFGTIWNCTGGIGDTGGYWTNELNRCNELGCSGDNESDTQCNTQCSGTQTCSTGDVDSVYQCNEGLIGNPKWNCHGLGCNPSTGSCNNACTNVGLTCGTVGTQSVSNNCYKESQNPLENQQLILNQTACLFGCLNGVCKSECVGDKICKQEDGYIHECSGGSATTKILDKCDSGGIEQGCTTLSGTTPKVICNNGCSTFGIYHCEGTDSIYCDKNNTNDQLFERIIPCGQLGCGTNGKCTGSIYKNSFDCAGINGEEIFVTDSSGYLLGNSLHNCNPGGLELKKNGLNPYCKPQVDVCTYCESGMPYCVDISGVSNIDKNLFYCGNETSASMISHLVCDAGCLIENGIPYCDNLSISSGLSNFPTDNTGNGNINLELTLEGSSSHNPIIDATVDAILSGAGINETKTGFKSNENGKVNIQFQQKPKGVYYITSTVRGYSNNIKTTRVVVTDSFTVGYFGTAVVYLIPGYSATTEITVSNPNTGAIPNDLIIIQNSNVSVSAVQSKVDTKRWVLTFGINTEPGKYKVTFKPSQMGVSSTEIIEQELEFEIRKPELKADINLPSSLSTTLGKHEYVLTITGPTIDNGIVKTTAITPDIKPTGTISYNSQKEDLSLLDQGGGRYLISYDFKDSGTYTLSFEASKAGYIDTTLSKVLQVSSSGKDSPPATDGSGTTTGTLGGTGGTNGINMWFIAGAVAVGIWLITRRKR